MENKVESKLICVEIGKGQKQSISVRCQPIRQTAIRENQRHFKGLNAHTLVETSTIAQMNVTLCFSKVS